MDTCLYRGMEALAIGLLISILLQDWRGRSVYGYSFAALACTLLAWRLLQDSWTAALQDTGVNYGFIGFQITAIWVYVRVRFPSAPSLLRYLGLGDILFWLAIASIFSPLLFILYFLASLLSSLLVYGTGYLLRFWSDTRVPLAGLQASFLALLITAHWLYPDWLPYDDSSLESLFTAL